MTPLSARQFRFGSERNPAARLTLHPSAFRLLSEMSEEALGGPLTIDVMADGQTARLPRRGDEIWTLLACGAVARLPLYCLVATPG